MNKSKSNFIKKITFNQIAFLNIQFAGEDRLLNSSMIDWVYGKRYGKIIIDLRYSFVQWKKSIFFASNIISLRGKLLYNDCIYGLIEYNHMLYYFFLIGQHFLNGIFSGGFISNFKYIYFELVKNFIENKKLLTSPDMNLSSYESIKELLGVKNLRRPPNIIFIPDGERSFWIAKSSVQVRIPAIAIVNPIYYTPGLFLPIPGSTSNTISLSIFVFILLSISIKGFCQELKEFYVLLQKKTIKVQLKIYYETEFRRTKKILTFKEIMKRVNKKK